ncbi:hypothetical protein ANN_07811 [Periplaneta americana]|uniref:Transposase n=1 Tax=Periplaneta americana TaxID=6978 RepID=A0ABQ8T117_PERAM|nr:hypothetical protein ANN_07811 [Periplaneta americana]
MFLCGGNNLSSDRPVQYLNRNKVGVPDMAMLRSLLSKETLRGHSDSSFQGEGYIQCCVGVRLCDMYSNQELAEIHFMYGKADGNAALARRLYQERGQPRSTTPEVQEEILEAVNMTPSISTRRVVLQVNVPHTTVWRLLKEYQLYPYHLQRQALSPADYPARVRFCQWFLEQCGVNPNFPALVLFTDEAQFTRDGITNFHNQHVWAYENPRATVPSHHQVRFSLNMWPGITGDRLVGPHVLVNRLTGQAYTNFLENTIPHVLEDTPLINRQHIHFLHDGAPAHFSRTARHYLDRRFPDRWIGRGGPIAWPPRSPNLNPLDFYLWGHLKSLVYSSPVPDLESLRNRIVACSEDIRNTPGVWDRVRRSMRHRCESVFKQEVDILNIFCNDNDLRKEKRSGIDQTVRMTVYRQSVMLLRFPELLGRVVRRRINTQGRGGEFEWRVLSLVQRYQLSESTSLLQGTQLNSTLRSHSTTPSFD